jgi:phage terminase small subunit
MRKLNTRQLKFCEEYVKGGCINATSAYIAAGYKTTNLACRVEACTNLTRPNILAYIEKLKQEYKINAEITADWCINQHIIEINAARERGDGATATANIAWIGKTKGIYSDGIVDNTDKIREIDESRKTMLREVASKIINSKPLLLDKGDTGVAPDTQGIAVRAFVAAPVQKVGVEGDIALPALSSSIVEPINDSGSAQEKSPAPSV